MADARAVAADAAGQLRAVLAAVGAGQIAAEADQVAYLRGAADALTVLADLIGPVSIPSFRDNADPSDG